MDTDVVIAGAGPTGLLLATELVLAHVRVAVCDRITTRGGQSKALNLQPRSAEILDLRGLLEPLLDRAVDRIPAGHFAGLPVPLDYSTMDTQVPYQLGIPQVRIETFLAERLAAHGVAVQYSEEVTGFDQDAAGVTVHTNSRRIRARYLVGCDGAHSTVRKALGIPFPGRDPRMSGLVADIRLTASTGDVPTRWQLPSLTPRDGAIVNILPIDDGVFRMLAAGPEQLAAGRDAPVPSDEVDRALRLAYGTDLKLGEVLWASRFTDTSRQAAQYRVGRVLLAGDAAHVHAPTGGQGLNLGLQDAFNLGWKLAAEIRGRAPDGLLDTYHAERHPVGAAVLTNTRAQGVLMVPDEDVEALRVVFSQLMRLPEANRYLAGLMSGLDIRYPIGSEQANHPLLGARMPGLGGGCLREGRGLLLRTNAAPDLTDALDAWSGQVDHADTSHIASGVRAALIRPDGYTAWLMLEPEDHPTSALRQWFGSSSTTMNA